MPKMKTNRSAAKRFALTGTPIENSLAELWSIFDFLMPQYLHSYSYFKENFEIPIIRNDDIEKQLTLKQMVEPFILRRTKKEVLTGWLASQTDMLSDDWYVID